MWRSSDGAPPVGVESSMVVVVEDDDDWELGDDPLSEEPCILVIFSEIQ